MNHIPVEVLHEIFIKIDLQDKIECMRVCRFWHDTLDRLTLLYHLDITSTQLPKLKDMLTRFPHRASQVECLILKGCVDFCFDGKELCNMFSNLRELSLGIFTSGRSQTHTSESVQFLNTTCKLEKLKESIGCYLTMQLAMSNLCSNLKTLDIDIASVNLWNANSNGISQLKNMPSLEELRMKNLSFKLMDLEVLHKNLPSIKRFYLNYTNPVSGDMPQDVRPTSLITELGIHIECAEDQHTLIQFYKYFGNKYSSVKNPFLEDETSYYDEGTEVIHRTFNEGIFPLYQKIGSKVERFLFGDYCTGMDVFRKFDGYGMKLKRLEIKMSWIYAEPFIGELAQSQQSRYIKKLILFDIIPESLSMLNKMEVLETLDISGSFFFDDDENVMRNEINLTQLFDGCPATLTFLTVHNIKLKYDGPTSNITSIKYLTITNVEITPLLATIIETSFPQLSTLSLSGEITSNVTISLVKLNLKQVKFTAMHDEDKNRNEYTIESKCDGGIQYHVIKRTPNKKSNGELYTYDIRAKPVVKREPEKSFALKFICPSVEQLSFSTAKKSTKY